MNQTRKLARHQLESFSRNGFLAIDRIIADDELSMLRDIYDRLFGSNPEKLGQGHFHLDGKRNDDGTYLPQILQPSRYFPELATLDYHSTVRDIARQVLGDKLEERHGEHMIFKPPRFGAVTRWHQDQTHQNLRLRYRNVNFWLALDDVTVANGCLQFVSGSHRRDVIYKDPDRFADQATACPLPAGGCTMHASYVLHYSGPNISNTARRAYILIFRAPATERETEIRVE
jgi:hypothetical protein